MPSSRQSSESHDDQDKASASSEHTLIDDSCLSFFQTPPSSPPPPPPQQPSSPPFDTAAAAAGEDAGARDSTGNALMVGLGHLENLCRLMEKMNSLRRENHKLTSRISFLEELNTLRRIRSQMRQKRAGRRNPSWDVDGETFDLYADDVEMSPSRRAKRHWQLLRHSLMKSPRFSQHRFSAPEEDVASDQASSGVKLKRRRVSAWDKVLDLLYSRKTLKHSKKQHSLDSQDGHPLQKASPHTSLKLKGPAVVIDVSNVSEITQKHHRQDPERANFRVHRFFGSVSEESTDDGAGRGLHPPSFDPSDVDSSDQCSSLYPDSDRSPLLYDSPLASPSKLERDDRDLLKGEGVHLPAGVSLSAEFRKKMLQWEQKNSRESGVETRNLKSLLSQATAHLHDEERRCNDSPPTLKERLKQWVRRNSDERTRDERRGSKEDTEWEHGKRHRVEKGIIHKLEKEQSKLVKEQSKVEKVLKKKEQIEERVRQFRRMLESDSSMESSELSSRSHVITLEGYSVPVATELSPAFEQKFRDWEKMHGWKQEDSPMKLLKGMRERGDRSCKKEDDVFHEEDAGDTDEARHDSAQRCCDRAVDTSSLLSSTGGEQSVTRSDSTRKDCATECDLLSPLGGDASASRLHSTLTALPEPLRSDLSPQVNRLQFEVKCLKEELQRTQLVAAQTRRKSFCGFSKSLEELKRQCSFYIRPRTSSQAKEKLFPNGVESSRSDSSLIHERNAAADSVTIRIQPEDLLRGKGLTIKMSSTSVRIRPRSHSLSNELPSLRPKKRMETSRSWGDFSVARVHVDESGQFLFVQNVNLEDLLGIESTPRLALPPPGRSALKSESDSSSSERFPSDQYLRVELKIVEDGEETGGERAEIGDEETPPGSAFKEEERPQEPAKEDHSRDTPKERAPPAAAPPASQQPAASQLDVVAEVLKRKARELSPRCRSLQSSPASSSSTLLKSAAELMRETTQVKRLSETTALRRADDSLLLEDIICFRRFQSPKHNPSMQPTKPIAVRLQAAPSRRCSLEQKQNILTAQLADKCVNQTLPRTWNDTLRSKLASDSVRPSSTISDSNASGSSSLERLTKRLRNEDVCRTERAATLHVSFPSSPASTERTSSTEEIVWKRRPGFNGNRSSSPEPSCNSVKSALHASTARVTPTSAVTNLSDSSPPAPQDSKKKRHRTSAKLRQFFSLSPDKRQPHKPKEQEGKTEKRRSWRNLFKLPK